MDRWLLTKGVVRLEPEFQVQNGTFSSFKVNQFFEAHGDEQYKAHAIEVALYYSPEKVVTKEVRI